MRHYLLIAFLVLLSNPGHAQDSATTKIAAGRAALVAHDLPAAKARFAEALALEPTNQTAAALAGLTRCFAIASLPESQAMLDRVGVAATGRDLYAWTATFTHDADGRPQFATGLNLDEAFAFWRDIVVVESERARAELAIVTDPAFTLTLQPGETQQPAALTIDYGDVQTMRAGLRGVEFLGHFARGQNTMAEVETILELVQGNLFSLSGLFERFPSLLTPGAMASTERAAARAALVDAIGLYREASASIRARPAGLDRLFMLETEDLPAEAEARDKLAKLERSLAGFADLTPEERDSHPLVDLGRVFDSGYSLRSQFPAARRFDPFAGIDLSCGGLLSGLTLERYVEGVVAAGFEADLGWEWVTPLPQGNALTCAAQGNGIHLLGGNAGTILRSTDAATWEPLQIPQMGGVSGLVFHNGRFIAVANNGVFASENGRDWELVTDEYRMGVHLTVLGGGLGFIDNEHRLVVSTDGLEWTPRGIVCDFAAGETLYYPRGLALGNGVIVAISDSGSMLHQRIFSSSDGGLTWTLRASGSATSYLGIRSLAYGNGRFVCAGNVNRLMTSTDGITWTPGTFLGSTGQGINGIIFDGTRFIATGWDGLIAVSTDGLTWTAATSPTSQHLGTAVSTSGHFWAFGDGGLVVHSTDAVHFSSIGASPTTAIPLQSQIRRLRTLGGKLFAVAADGKLYVSTDGSTFGAATADGTLSVTDLTESAGTYVAVGPSAAYTSTDGVTWTTRAPGTSGWNPLTVARAGNLYIASGSEGRVFTSPDGVTWTRRNDSLLPANPETWLVDFAYGNGMYYGVGWTWESGQMAALTALSTDGTTWNWTSVSPGSGKLLHVDFHDGVFRTFTSNGQLWEIPGGSYYWSGDDGNGIDTPGALYQCGGRRVIVQDAFTVFDYEELLRDRVAFSAGDHAWIGCPAPIESNSPSVWSSARYTEPPPFAYFGGRVYLGGNGLIVRSRAIATVAAPTLFTSPADRAAKAGDTVALAAGVYGEGRLTYQWYKSDVAISGATTPELLFAAVQPEDAGAYHVVVSNGFGTVASAAANLTVAVSFADWQSGSFTAAELGDPTISGALAVAGPDGATNLLKYALGVSARSSVPVDRQVVSPPVAGAPDQWTLLFRRPANRPDVTYEVETSTNLAGWTTGGVTIERVATADANGLETWRAVVTATGPRLFLRLKVNLK